MVVCWEPGMDQAPLCTAGVESPAPSGLMLIRRRRLGSGGQKTSAESSANVRTVLPASGVTFRAFSVYIDRVSRTLIRLVALVDWR